MKKIDYEVAVVCQSDFDEHLIWRGSQGWEFVSIVSNEKEGGLTFYKIIFKRSET